MKMIEARNRKTGAVMKIYLAAYKANPKNWEPLDESLKVDAVDLSQSNSRKYKSSLSAAIAFGNRHLAKQIACTHCRSKKKTGCRTCNEN